MRWYTKANLEKGETIKMTDVVSEYPNANFREEYPIGHPKIYLLARGRPAALMLSYLIYVCIYMHVYIYTNNMIRTYVCVEKCAYGNNINRKKKIPIES